MTLVPDSFWKKIDKNGPVPNVRPDLGACWLWLGSSWYGYGKYRGRRVHRLVYMLLVGEVPDGLELDHLCRVRHCCNPRHLEPVTHKVNVRRGAAMQNVGNAAMLALHQGNRRTQTHCLRGHSFDEKNTYWKKGKRICRACNALHQRRFLVKATT